MIGLVESPRAFWMAHGMARLRGVRLAEAVLEGWISRAELAELVCRCQSCGHTTECEGWLAEPQRQTPTPGFCDIRPQIEALAEPDAS